MEKELRLKLQLLRTENDIIALIEQDEWMMEIIRQAKSLELPDWWVCAGFVRNKIWDTLHGYRERTPLSDVDVVYYDASQLDESIEKVPEDRLKQLDPTIPWSVKNQARMHLINAFPPYTSSVDAISKFPETVTALGVSLDDNNRLLLTAPHGVEDVLQLMLKPTPYFAATPERMKIYERRIQVKAWHQRWHEVKVIRQTN